MTTQTLQKLPVTPAFTPGREERIAVERAGDLNGFAYVSVYDYQLSAAHDGAVAWHVQGCDGGNVVLFEHKMYGPGSMREKLLADRAEAFVRAFYIVRDTQAAADA